MAGYRVAVVVGSLRKDSFNRRLALALAKIAPPEFDFVLSDIGDLPLYNQDDDEHQAASVKRFKKEIRESLAVLFVTPEYNRSVPGVLKNAIDHASRPYAQSAWDGKPAAIVGLSVGALGSALAQQHLRNVLSCLNMPVLPQPDVYLQYKEGLFDGENIGESSKKFLQSWMNAFCAWIQKYASV